jgi:hypothetical protein
MLLRSGGKGAQDDISTRLETMSGQSIIKPPEFVLWNHEPRTDLRGEAEPEVLG